MSAYDFNRQDIPARAAALVVREWCCVKAELLVWRHYTHFEAQRAGCRIVVVDLLCDGFGEVFCAAEFGVQVQVKEVGFCVGFVFLRCDSVKRLVRRVLCAACEWVRGRIAPSSDNPIMQNIFHLASTHTLVVGFVADSAVAVRRLSGCLGRRVLVLPASRGHAK